jgi:beta-mannosidase
MNLKLFSVAVMCAPMLAAASSVDLSGNWNLTSVDGRHKVKAAVPGDNYSALEAAKILPDPYWRLNENKVQWVAHTDWVYDYEFDIPAEVLAARDAVLSFDSIDTVGEVFLNGKSLGKVDNEFRRWRFPVKGIAKAGKNKVEVRLRSVAGAIADDVKKHPHPHVISWGCGLHRQMVRLRKAQCSQGWDWGVALPVSGIYGKTEIFSCDVAYLEYLWDEQKHNPDGSVEVTLTAELMPTMSAKAGESVNVDFEFAGEKRTVSAKVPRNCGAFKVTTTFKVAKPELWWPNGMGAQKLYPASVTAEGRAIRRKIGLRTIELVREDEGEKGETFFFRCNGKAFFVKGVNWIPCEAHPSRRTEERIAHHLDLAAKANMNMIRVWGGGVYEQDCFYEKCDELGLLVWQDMMFACGVYPDWKEFIDNVRAEVKHQVKRLRSHPSVALWCGDNENLSCVYVTRSYYALIDRLIRVIWEVLLDADNTRVFWPTSPCSGDREYERNFDKDRGDCHLWGVKNVEKNYEGFFSYKPRFVSEYGFRSYPSMKLIRTFATNEDMSIESPVMLMHLKKKDLQKQIAANIEYYYGKPKNCEHHVELSRKWQAKATVDVTRKWMKDAPYCGGVLFWMLNDWWPVTSESLIDHDGTPKPALEALGKLFAEEVPMDELDRKYKK